MRTIRSELGLVLQGYFRADRFQRTANRATVTQLKRPVRSNPHAPRPDLLPSRMRDEPMQAKQGPIRVKVPRPDLFPPMMRGIVGQTKAEHGAVPQWSGAPRPELLPGMGPARVGDPLQVVQARSRNGISVTPLPAVQLQVLGQGRPLKSGIRQTLESFFQADFSGVRVHEGPVAQAMGALAFTLGKDIYFAPGLYDPTTREGVELLGHELAHVVQQREGRVVNPYGRGVAIVQDPALEAEADLMGQRVADESYQVGMLSIPSMTNRWRFRSAMASSSNRKAIQCSAHATAANEAWEICKWFQENDQGRQQSNYSVGVTTNDEIVISKVGGTTDDTDLIKTFCSTWNTQRMIYVAQSFNTSGTGGNHGEMCVYAGCEDGLGETLTHLYCTHPNCKYCAAFLKIYKITTRSVNTGEPKSQSSWYHPVHNLVYGSQLGSNESAQVKEMVAITKDPSKEVRLGRKTEKVPKGRVERIL